MAFHSAFAGFFKFRMLRSNPIRWRLREIRSGLDVFRRQTSLGHQEDIGQDPEKACPIKRFDLSGGILLALEYQRSSWAAGQQEKETYMKNKTWAALATSGILATFALSANAQQTPDFLQGSSAVPMTQSEMDSIRGEAFPAALILAVRLAPSLNALLASAIRNHFPVMLIRHAWERYRGR